MCDTVLMMNKDIVSTWEAGTLPRAEWKHAAHLTVAAWYVFEEGAAALDRVRAGINRYNTGVGIISTPDYGYHETITRFWVERLAVFFGEEGPFVDQEAAVAAAVAKFAVKRDWYADYWSFDVTKSREARAAWVPPDRQPIGIPQLQATASSVVKS